MDSFDWRFFFGCIAVCTILFAAAARVGGTAPKRAPERSASPVLPSPSGSTARQPLGDNLPSTTVAPTTSSTPPAAAQPPATSGSAGRLPATRPRPTPPPTVALLCLQDAVFRPCPVEPTALAPA